MEGFEFYSTVIIAGMIVVAVGIIVLLASIASMTRRVRSLGGEKAPDMSQMQLSPVHTPPQNDLSLIAVITAAVTAAMGSEKPVVIKSIRPIQRQASAWAQAGRRESMF